MSEECLKIQAGTCSKCSACGIGCKHYEPKKEVRFPYGYTMWGGQMRESLPHGARYYMK